MTKNSIAVFGTLIAYCLVGQVHSQGTRTSILPITIENEASCEEIIAVSTFGGDCCSLFSTPSNGCILTVIAGNCVIDGDIWILDFTSTDPINSCREGDFPITSSPTSSPIEGAPTADGQAAANDGSSSTGVALTLGRLTISALALGTIWSLCA